MLRCANDERLLGFFVREVHQPTELVRAFQTPVANEPRSWSEDQLVEVPEHEAVELCVDSLLSLESKQRGEQTTETLTAATDLVTVSQQNLGVINLE